MSININKQSGEVIIVWDMDGCLNNLNDVVMKELGLTDKFNRRTSYLYEPGSPMEILTPDEIEEVHKKYRDDSTFLRTRLLENADLITRVVRKAADKGIKARVIINSECHTPEVADVKCMQLMNGVSDLQISDMILQVESPKQAIRGADIVVDDNVYHLREYDDNTTKVLMMHNYNTKRDYSEAIKAGHAIVGVNNILEAVEFIESRVLRGIYSNSEA